MAGDQSLKHSYRKGLALATDIYDFKFNYLLIPFQKANYLGKHLEPEIYRFKYMFLG